MVSIFSENGCGTCGYGGKLDFRLFIFDLMLISVRSHWGKQALYFYTFYFFLINSVCLCLGECECSCMFAVDSQHLD